MISARGPSLAAILAFLLTALPSATQAQVWRQATRTSLHSAADALRPGQYIWSDRQSWRAGNSDDWAPVRLIVSIALQKLYVYRGEELVGAASISTGAEGHNTPLGTFPILQKARFHRSNIYSNAPMPFMQRLTWTGIALHAGHNPGHPASHGCVRLPLAFAKDLFAITRLGTEVAVTELPELPASPHWLLVDEWVWADWRSEDELSFAAATGFDQGGLGGTHWFARDEVAGVRLDYSPTVFLMDAPQRRYPR